MGVFKGRINNVRSTAVVYFTFDLNGRLQHGATGMSCPLCVQPNYGPRQQGRQQSTALLLEFGSQGKCGSADGVVGAHSSDLHFGRLWRARRPCFEAVRRGDATGIAGRTENSSSINAPSCSSSI